MTPCKYSPCSRPCASFTRAFTIKCEAAAGEWKRKACDCSRVTPSSPVRLPSSFRSFPRAHSPREDTAVPHLSERQGLSPLPNEVLSQKYSEYVQAGERQQRTGLCKLQDLGGSALHILLRGNVFHFCRDRTWASERTLRVHGDCTGSPIPPGSGPGQSSI